jgi:hypothetical protein
MSHRTLRRGLWLATLAATASGTMGTLAAQGRGAAAAPAGPPPTARASAPIDLTGTWVSIVTEDWRWRMVTPAKGDYQSVPITPEAMKVADAWDPAKDTAANEQCRSYGAAGLMRVPGRARISWADDNTLKVEYDAGTQTRLLQFGSPKPPTGGATWQGHSVAQWEGPRRAARGRGAAPGAPPPPPPAFGNLKVVTTRMKPGYLRKNGIPYSAAAVLTEYWDLYKQPNGTQWLVITTLIDDPKYLQRQYVTSPNFKREPNDSKWEPTPCSATW